MGGVEFVLRCLFAYFVLTYWSILVYLEKRRRLHDDKAMAMMMMMMMAIID